MNCCNFAELFNLKILCMNITYKEKDAVLNYLCNCDEVVPERLSQINRLKYVSHVGTDEKTALSVLQYFNRIGIVSNLNYRYHSDTFYVIVRQEAFDLLNRGGFTVKEYLLQQEVEKLLLEIERLKPSIGDKIEKISTIVSNIANIIKAF